MNAEELEMMLEGDGEEVDISQRRVDVDDVELAATQSSDDCSRGFQPLFED